MAVQTSPEMSIRELEYSLSNRTYRSNHGIFHLVGIPFLYFGVPEHFNYHQTSDDYENISHSFYYTGVNLILESVDSLDRNFPPIKRRKITR